MHQGQLRATAFWSSASQHTRLVFTGPPGQQMMQLSRCRPGTSLSSRACCPRSLSSQMRATSQAQLQVQVVGHAVCVERGPLGLPMKQKSGSHLLAEGCRSGPAVQLSKCHSIVVRN